MVFSSQLRGQKQIVVLLGVGMGLPLFVKWLRSGSLARCLEKLAQHLWSLGVRRVDCVELTRGVKFGVGMGLSWSLGVGRVQCVELTCGVEFGVGIGLPLFVKWLRSDSPARCLENLNWRLWSLGVERVHYVELTSGVKFVLFWQAFWSVGVGCLSLLLSDSERFVFPVCLPSSFHLCLLNLKANTYLGMLI